MPKSPLQVCVFQIHYLFFEVTLIQCQEIHLGQLGYLNLETNLTHSLIEVGILFSMNLVDFQSMCKTCVLTSLGEKGKWKVIKSLFPFFVQNISIPSST